ncbi:hypothetical protein D1F64_16590 [Breoghania sp. L-A4]|nr:hypothetical protein D1F64_16590 [Breoghania sp. L-A4]
MGHHHDHHHDHGHSHDHAHPHDHAHDHPHPHGHNSADADHLHSHFHGNSRAARIEELQTLSESFIDGFRKADDKTSYLRLAHIPFDRLGSDGLTMRLVDVEIAAAFQVATASPGFGSKELVYMPYPGSMVKERTTMRFVYVSTTERTDVDLLDLLPKIDG